MLESCALNVTAQVGGKRLWSSLSLEKDVIRVEMRHPLPPSKDGQIHARRWQVARKLIRAQRQKVNVSKPSKLAYKGEMHPKRLKDSFPTLQKDHGKDGGE